MSDDLFKKIAKFEEDFGADRYDEDTAGAITCIQNRKGSILNSVYKVGKYKRHPKAMKMIAEYFPKADMELVKKELIKIGLPTKDSDKRKLIIVLSLWMIPLAIITFAILYPYIKAIAFIATTCVVAFIFFSVYSFRCIDIDHYIDDY